jgi:hypothetical protein
MKARYSVTLALLSASLVGALATFGATRSAGAATTVINALPLSANAPGGTIAAPPLSAILNFDNSNNPMAGWTGTMVTIGLIP